MDALARADGKDKGCRIGSREVSRVTREDARSMNCGRKWNLPWIIFLLPASILRTAHGMAN